MPITKANYKLPEWGRDKEKKEPYVVFNDEELCRKKFEEHSIVERGAKGSFVIFREKGLEDVFVVDEL